MFLLQTVNPKLFEMVTRTDSFGGNRGRWGYKGFQKQGNNGSNFPNRFGAAGGQNRFGKCDY